jgi:hypothetical protein
MHWVYAAAGTFMAAAVLLPPVINWHQKRENLRVYRAARDQLRVGMTEAEVAAVFAGGPAVRGLCGCGPDDGAEEWSVSGGSVRVLYKYHSPDRQVTDIRRSDSEDPALADSLPNPPLTAAVAGCGVVLALLGLLRRHPVTS